MRKCLSIVIVLFILAQTWRDSAMFTYYYFQQEYITEQYCVNILRPELMCNGKCYLNDVLLDLDEESAPDAAIFIAVQKVPIWFFFHYLGQNSEILFPKTPSSFFWVNHYRYLPERSVFRPPLG